MTYIGMPPNSLIEGDIVKCVGDGFAEAFRDTEATVTKYSEGLLGYSATVDLSNGYFVPSGRWVILVERDGKRVTDVARITMGNIAIRYEDGSVALWRITRTGQPEGRWEEGEDTLTREKFRERYREWTVLYTAPEPDPLTGAKALLEAAGYTVEAPAPPPYTPGENVVAVIVLDRWGDQEKVAWKDPNTGLWETDDDGPDDWFTLLEEYDLTFVREYGVTP